jgi:5-methylcytosine-specific restriction enzyme A
VSLARACLGCGVLVRGASRCAACKAKRERAKAAARPGRKRADETRRRREAVATHRATVGDWCPGVPELRRPAHPSADLTADHLHEVRLGGAESGPLVVRCRPCNSARSANVARTVLAQVADQHRFPMSAPSTPPHQPNATLHTASEPAGPVVA